MPDTEAYLARITPVNDRHPRRLLSLSNLLLHSILLIAFQASWMVWMFLGLWLLHVQTMLAAAVLLLASGWLCMQFVMVFVYPEWPLNRMLSWRLVQRVRERVGPLVSPADDDVRVVELVPRERWRTLSLETATDLMLIRVDGDGVWMTGDRHEYELPCESILGAEFHSVIPSGWFTATYMAIIFLRSEAGQIELPISYRDHGFGSLRGSRRRARSG